MVGALVERITALQAAHTLDAAPQRSAPRHPATVAEAVTTRIRRREQADTAAQQDVAPSSRSLLRRSSRIPATAPEPSCHACPGAAGPLATSPAVTPVLGTISAGVTRATCSPQPPAGELCRSLALLVVRVASPPCRRRQRPPEAPPWAASPGASTRNGERACSACRWPSAAFLPP